LAGTVADAFIIASQTAQGIGGVHRRRARYHEPDHERAGKPVQRLVTARRCAIAAGCRQHCDGSDRGSYGDVLPEGHLFYLLTTLMAQCTATPGNDWAVNSIAGGDATSGMVAATGDSTATYSAPATQPAANPVAVSASTLLQPLNELAVHRTAPAVSEWQPACHYVAW
jgi:hypothetical protein